MQMVEPTLPTSPSSPRPGTTAQNYVFSLLLGYREPPAGVSVRPWQYQEAILKYDLHACALQPTFFVARATQATAVVSRSIYQSLN